MEYAPFIVNSATQRAAYGLRFYAGRQHQSPVGQESWHAMSAKMTAWTLAAPQHHGFFPTVYDAERGVWLAGSETPNASASVNPSGYSVGTCAATGVWLLRWYTDLADDSMILPFVRRLGDGLVEMQRADGGFPLSLSSSTLGVVALFLAQLAQATGDSSYARALVRVCATLMAVMDNPDCSAGLALLKAYRLSGDRSHLEKGLRLADELGEMNDGTPAELYAEAYRLTMNQDYALRALAAMRGLRPVADLLHDTDQLDFEALSTWAILEANYPDVLVLS
ncbi:MAG: hypothetical protein H0X37_03150 [Herpetosiphonaceae bacterium]|nr:hypothetical protein [Herpetosiphonaceae bacterium]